MPTPDLNLRKLLNHSYFRISLYGKGSDMNFDIFWIGFTIYYQIIFIKWPKMRFSVIVCAPNAIFILMIL